MKKGECVVLIADGIPDKEGESVQVDAVTLPSVEKIGVRRNYDPMDPIGWARLHWDGPKLMATLEIDDDKIEGEYYPGIAGQYLEKRQISRGHIAYSVRIDYIGLGVARNVDRRIEPLSL